MYPPVPRKSITRAIPELRRQAIVAFYTGQSGLGAALLVALSVLADSEDTAHLAAAAGIRDRDDLPWGAEAAIRDMLDDADAARLLGPDVYYDATVNTATGEIRVGVPGAEDATHGPTDGPAAGRLTRIHLAPWGAGEGGLDRALEALAPDWQVHTEFRAVPERADVWTAVVVPTALPSERAGSADDMPAGGA